MTVAFLDHHLENWHAKVFLRLLRERGHEVVAYETDPVEEDWCAANDVPRTKGVEDAVDRSDAIMLLAPDDVESHLDLALVAIPAGKPIWIDKLVAPTAEEALRILQAAEYHATPVTSGSSLRHAVELEDALGDGPAVEEAFFTGYGTWERYGVHTVAMALRSLGGGVRRLVNTGTPSMPVISLEWSDGRRASLVVGEGDGASAAFPWRFAFRRGGAWAHGEVKDFGAFYVRQAEAILRDFETGASHSRDEMMDTVRLLEIAPTTREWTNLESR